MPLQTHAEKQIKGNHNVSRSHLPYLDETLCGSACQASSSVDPTLSREQGQNGGREEKRKKTEKPLCTSSPNKHALAAVV